VEKKKFFIFVFIFLFFIIIPLKTNLFRPNILLFLKNRHSDYYYIDKSNSYDTYWIDGGVVVSNAGGDQRYQSLCTDDNGGAIIVWHDTRSGAGSPYDIYAQRVDQEGDSVWTQNGIAITSGMNNELYPLICSDGVGGAIIAWVDGRGGTGYEDIYAQRVNSSGSILWTQNGVVICNASNAQANTGGFDIVSDGFGGAIIVWEDSRYTTTKEIFAQRIDSNGNTLWTANGTVICNATNDQLVPKLCSDGNGGAIITWEDIRSGIRYDVYAQKVNSTGHVQWIENGIAIANNSGHKRNPVITSDGSGGAIVAWQDERSGPPNIYTQRIAASGSFFWGDNGTFAGGSGSSDTDPVICGDGENGAIIAWTDGNIYAQRVNSSGDRLWTLSGEPICTATGTQDKVSISSDDYGGAIITWIDRRVGDYNIYAQIINSTGDIQMELNGKVIYNDDGLRPKVISDQAGGAIIAFTYCPGSIFDIHAQRIKLSIPPTSSHPNDIITDAYGLDTVNWTLYDSSGPGMYRVWVNDTSNEYYVWQNWTAWTNNTNFQVSINRTAPGIFNYTIEYNNSEGVFGNPDTVFVNITNSAPTSNHPQDIITYASGSETIDWILYDDFGPGKYRIEMTDPLNVTFQLIGWINWFNGSFISVQINRSIPGIFNYSIYFNDSSGDFGIPDSVIVTVFDNVPTSSHPDDFFTPISGNDNITWTLYDDFGGGYYQVWVEHDGDKHIWKSYTSWLNNTPLNIEINRTTIGIYNYSIEYNDSYGQWGGIDWIIVTVGGNNGLKQLLNPGKNSIYQYDDEGFLWVNLTIFVTDTTNITITTNTSRPASFGTFTGFLFYEIELDNETVLDNITIRFYYNKTLVNGTPDQKLAIYYYDSDVGVWKLINSYIVDDENNFIEITLTHLTRFVLYQKPETSLFFLPPPAATNDSILILVIIIGSVAAVSIIVYSVKKRKRSVTPVESEKGPLKPQGSELQIKRAYDYIGGNIRYKVVVENISDHVIKDISVELNVKKQQYEIDTPLKIIEILEPGESIGSDFILTPLTCGKSRIHGNVNYKTAGNELISFEIAPSVVQIKCPLVQPKEVSRSELIELMQKLQKSHTEINYSGLLKIKAYQIAKEQISSLDVSEVEEQEDKYHILYSGEAKVGGDLIIIDLSMTEDYIIIDVYLKDIKQATGFLAYIKNLISLAIQYSSKISTTMDAITNKIYNAFEFASRLSELYNLCAEEEALDDILLLLKELNIKLSKYFPDLKITEIFRALLTNWISELEKIKGEKIWERTYLNLQYDILNWMDGIITISETNSKTYFDSPTSDRTTIENIKLGNSQLKKQVDLMNRHYSQRILFALMMVNKTSGLSMYNHNFTEKSLDSDLIGGFLTAIQSFGTELSSDAKETSMQKLSYQHFEIRLEEGTYTVAALITSGIPNQLTIDRLKIMPQEFEKKFESKLQYFTGDVSAFDKTKDMVNTIFLK